MFEKSAVWPMIQQNYGVVRLSGGDPTALERHFIFGTSAPRMSNWIRRLSSLLLLKRHPTRQIEEEKPAR